MKRILLILQRSAIAAAMALYLLGAVASAAEYGVIVNDTPMVFNDVKPQNIDDRILLPLRAVSEALGVPITWSDEEKGLFMRNRSTVIFMKIGDANIYEYDEVIATLEVPPQLIGDKTYVPVRAVSEIFGMDVHWDDDTDTVLITSPTIGDVTVSNGLIDLSICEPGTDTVWAHITAQYPVLLGDSKAIGSINDAVREMADEFYTYAVNFVEDTPPDLDIEEPFEFDLMYDVTCAADGVFSICATTVSGVSAARPWVDMTGATFDLKTGDRLEADDVLNMDADEIYDAIVKGLKALYNEADAMYDAYDEATLRDMLMNELGMSSFYVTDEAVAFIFPAYTLSPFMHEVYIER